MHNLLSRTVPVTVKEFDYFDLSATQFANLYMQYSSHVTAQQAHISLENETPLNTE